MAILYFMLILCLTEVVTSDMCSVCHASCNCSASADYCAMTCPSVQDFNNSVLMENPNITALYSNGEGTIGGIFKQSGFTNITKLSLQNNGIIILNIDVFSGLTGLEELDLSDNEIITLVAGVFNGLSGLKDLRLSNNSLIILENGVFSNLSALEYLHLNNNQFTTLEPDVFSGLPSLLFIYIDGNPLNCSCMEWFITWIRNNSASTSYTCQPSETPILDFNNFEYCSDYRCSFESGTTCFLHYHNSSLAETLDWILKTGFTPSRYTGPSLAFNGNYYMYAEASSFSRSTYLLESNILPSHGNSCLGFAYHMLGIDMGTLLVNITYPGTSRSPDIWSVSGNQGQDWHLADINVPPGPVKIYIEATIGGSYISDIAIDEVNFESGSCQINECEANSCLNNGSCTDDVNGFTCGCVPGFIDTNCSSDYRCSFETGTTCFLHNSSLAETLDWILITGPTYSYYTGPPSAFNGSYYMYAEASGLFRRTYLLESNILPSNGSSCLRFAYHMYGNNMGTLTINITYPGTSRSPDVSSVSGNQSYTWHLADINVPSGPVKIYFNATIGNAYKSDIAIDEVNFESGSCQTNECQPDPCQNNGSCTDGIIGYTCACYLGYTGKNCSTEINECESNPCQNNGSCTDDLNGYTCACSPGYTGAHCSSDINECESNPCHNNGSCTDKVNGYTCACLPGYTATNCSSDIDECATTPCQNNGSCTDGINGYTCACIPGYTDTNCSSDINECASNPCGSAINCIDGINSYICNCTDGTIGTTCSAASAASAPISQAGIALIATGTVIFVAALTTTVVVIVFKVLKTKTSVDVAN